MRHRKMKYCRQLIVLVISVMVGFSFQSFSSELNTSESNAFESSLETKTEGPHRKGLISNVILGARFSSLIQNRGVVFYKDYQIDPVISVFFLDDRVEFLGDSLSVRGFVAGNWLRLRSKITSITDQPLFPNNESIRTASPKRGDTYEWTQGLEFFIPGYDKDYVAEIDFNYTKDISLNHGDYFEFISKIKLFDFHLPGFKALIEPNFIATVGWGDAASNAYYYGPDVNNSGFTNTSYGLLFALPEKVDRRYPNFIVSRFETLGNFRHGEYAQTRESGWLVSFISAFGIW